MQPGICRLFLFRLSPALSGLALAALVPVGSAIAGEVAAGGPAMLWHHLQVDDGGAGVSHYPRDFRGLMGFEFSPREVGEGVTWRGLFFRAGDGLRIGAQGSFEPGSGNLRAIVALKLDF